jgi:sugar phosphate isomerase/epimerase
MGKTGVQLYSVWELAQKDFIGTIGAMAGIGFEGVEFAGFFNTPAKELRNVLDNLGLKAAGSHTQIDACKSRLAEIIEYNLEIGNRFKVCPYLPEDMRSSADTWKKTAGLFNEIGLKCSEYGIKFGYHNHEFEFQKFGDEYGLDILAANTQPEYCFMQLDVYFIELSGLNPVDFIKKYNGRSPTLHMKDMKSFDDKQNTIIGKGIVDFNGIAKAAKMSGTEWFIIEQEEYEEDHVESLKKGCIYLKNILK